MVTRPVNRPMIWPMDASAIGTTNPWARGEGRMVNWIYPAVVALAVASVVILFRTLPYRTPNDSLRSGFATRSHVHHRLH